MFCWKLIKEGSGTKCTRINFVDNTQTVSKISPSNLYLLNGSVVVCNTETSVQLLKINVIKIKIWHLCQGLTQVYMYLISLCFHFKIWFFFLDELWLTIFPHIKYDISYFLYKIKHIMKWAQPLQQKGSRDFGRLEIQNF